MSSLQEQSNAVADKAMEAALDSLMLLHRQAFNSVMVLDREQRKETAEQRKNGIAALLQEGVDKTSVEAALNSVMVLHREALNLVLKKNRDEQRRKETTANNEQQKNNEIIADLKKELVQWKETAEQQNNEIIDLKKELVELKEVIVVKKAENEIIAALKERK